MTCIEQHVDSVSAVLVLADGRLGTPVDMDCTLSALSALIPKALGNNIAFMFTHVRDSHFSGLLRFKVPRALRGNPVFLLDNPITPSVKLSFDSIVKSEGKAYEQRALEVLVKLFDWLDSLEPQPATEIVYLYEQYQNIEAKTIHILDQRAREVNMRAKIDRLMITSRSILP